MGVLGYVLRKLDFEMAPIVLGLVLAPMMEMALRQSLAMSAGDYAIFVHAADRGHAARRRRGARDPRARPLRRRGLDWRARLALAEKGEEAP